MRTKLNLGYAYVMDKSFGRLKIFRIIILAQCGIVLLRNFAGN